MNCLRRGNLKRRQYKATNVTKEYEAPDGAHSKPAGSVNPEGPETNGNLDLDAIVPAGLDLLRRSSHVQQAHRPETRTDPIRPAARLAAVVRIGTSGRFLYSLNACTAFKLCPVDDFVESLLDLRRVVIAGGFDDDQGTAGVRRHFAEIRLDDVQAT